MNAAVAQQLIEAAERDLGDGNVDDLRRMFATLQELREQLLILDRLLAALACQKEPESILHLSLSLFRV